MNGEGGRQRDEEQAQRIEGGQAPEEQDHARRGVGGGCEQGGGLAEELPGDQVDNRGHAQHAGQAEAARELQPADHVQEPADDRVNVRVTREIRCIWIIRDGAARPMVDDLPPGVEVQRLVLEGRVTQRGDRDRRLQDQDEKDRPARRNNADASPARLDGGLRSGVAGYGSLPPACSPVTISRQAASDSGSDASDQLFNWAAVGLRIGPPSWYRRAYTAGSHRSPVPAWRATLPSPPPVQRR